MRDHGTRFQAFVALAQVAPDGHTRWHSITAGHSTIAAALERTREHLEGHRVYDLNRAIVRSRVAVFEHDIQRAHEAALDEVDGAVFVGELVLSG